MSSLRNSMRARIGAAALLALASATPGNAGGLAFEQFQPDVPVTSPGLKDPVDLAVSADGRNVYVASESENSVAVYTRDLGTGHVSFLDIEEDGVGGVDGLRRTTSVAVTQDGRCVYATGETDNAVAAFARTPATGVLTYLASVSVDAPQRILVSPDDLDIYVITRLSGSSESLQVFRRTPPSCSGVFVEEETGDADGLGKLTRALAISPDGSHVYVGGTSLVGGQSLGALNVLSRNPATGALTFVERVVDGSGGVDYMETLDNVTVSPDGTSVYVASRGGDSVVVFDRNPGTGALGFVEYQRDGGVVDGLKGAFDVAVTPDGAYVLATGHSDGIAVFRRDLATGALRFLEADEDPLIDPPNVVLEVPQGLALSPGGEHVYAGARGLTVFAADDCGNGTRGPDEQCDDGNVGGGDGCSATCRLELCGALPSVSCRDTLPSGAQLRIKNQMPNTKDQLQFKWNTGDATPLADFGDPLTSASYLMCLYDGSGGVQPVLASAAPAAGGCKKDKPCWKAAGTSYKYNDGLYTPDGIQGLSLKEGLFDGSARMQVKSRGINIVPPPMPLTLPVTVQVHNTETGVCWEAVFSAAGVNDAESFKATAD